VSRSRRKTPISGHGAPRPGAEGWFKRNGHKRWRQAVKQALAKGEAPPEFRAIADVWGYPKDGKAWHGEWCDMRK